MNLSTLARTRLAETPLPAQRYGLGVMLRKAYPAVGNWEQTMGNRDTAVRVRGAAVARATWDDLPAEIAELVRRRAAGDAMTAAHVLRTESVQVVPVSGKKSVVLEYLVTPGAFTTLFVDVAPQAELEIQESLNSATISGSVAEKRERVGEADMASVFVLLRVGEGARVRWFGQSVGAPGCTMIERMALLAQDAVLEQYSVLLAANAVRENTHVVLAAPGATARVATLFLGAADHQFDLGVTAEHRAPQTKSDLRAKGVLTGCAQGVYRGLIRVAKNGVGADGYQRCDALLLSPTAEVDPIPQLEIETNDVRCTHGVTVSHVSPEHLFYLRSRGFSEAAARGLLVGGFIRDVLGQYLEPSREHLERAVRVVLATV